MDTEKTMTINTDTHQAIFETIAAEAKKPLDQRETVNAILQTIVDAGYVIVPREPTTEMRMEFARYSKDFEIAYDAMLDAVPKTGCTKKPYVPYEPYDVPVSES